MSIKKFIEFKEVKRIERNSQEFKGIHQILIFKNSSEFETNSSVEIEENLEGFYKKHFLIN